MKKKKNKIITYSLLQFAFFIYSLSSFFSKFSTYNNDDIKIICLFYLLSLICLGVYAIVWQQILKNMSLSTAFSNKGITLVWGLVLGAIFFKENITIGKVIGAIIVIIGIIILMKNENKKTEVKKNV